MWSELSLPWSSPCHFGFRLRRKFHSCGWTPTGESEGMGLRLLRTLPGAISKSPTYLAHLESSPGHHKDSQPTLPFLFPHSLSLFFPSFPSSFNSTPVPRPLPVVPSHTTFICLPQAALVCGATSPPGWSAGRRHALHSHY